MRTFALAILLLAALPALCLSVAVPAGAAPAPKLPIADLKHLPVVTMRPYDEAANADAAVDAALAKAKIDHKLVLIDLGGNWCPDCIILANLMRLPDMRRFIDAHYDVVMIDVGRFDKNLQIPVRFGITQRLEGVPSVLVVTPEGRLVNPGHVSALADARSMAPQAIADWLASWVN